MNGLGRFLFMGLVGLSTLAVLAPARADCGSAEARAFDFWIGDWKIDQKLLQRDGTWIELAAATSVSKALDGCALVEHWTGEVQFFWEGMTAPEPMQGLSVRSWDPARRTWSIFWMDSRTPTFGEPFRGGFEDGRGEFFRKDAGGATSRIVFSEIEERSLLWTLSVSRDDGKTWTDVWVMRMRRAAEPLSDQVGE